MAVAWLAGLPRCPLPYESQEQLGDNSATFQPDVGAPMRRMRSTVAHDNVTLAFKMTRQQLEMFKSFYRTTLRHGTVPFTLERDPFTGVAAEYAFGSAPNVERVGADSFKVSFSTFRKPS